MRYSRARYPRFIREQRNQSLLSKLSHSSSLFLQLLKRRIKRKEEVEAPSAPPSTCFLQEFTDTEQQRQHRASIFINISYAAWVPYLCIINLKLPDDKLMLLLLVVGNPLKIIPRFYFIYLFLLSLNYNLRAVASLMNNQSGEKKKKCIEFSGMHLITRTFVRVLF